MFISQALAFGSAAPVNGGKLFKRKVTVTVNGLQVSGLRVAFEIDKTLEKQPNTCDLQIYNLSQSSQKQIQGTGVSVIVEAGYSDTGTGIIFAGPSRTIDHEKHGPDVVSRIQCGDGETVYQFSRFVQSFAAGVQIADVIRAAAKATTLNLGNLEDALKLPFTGGKTVFSNGFTASGRAVQVLDTLLKSAGFTWSIQQGAIQVLQGGQPVNPQAVLLTPATGLVGSPQYVSPDKKGFPSKLKVKSLLQHQFRCGHVVAVKTDTINGQFRIEKLKFTGDTAGQDWYADLEVLPI